MLSERSQKTGKHKTITTKYTLHDPIFMTFLKRQNCNDKNQNGGCQGLGWVGIN